MKKRKINKSLRHSLGKDISDALERANRESDELDQRLAGYHTGRAYLVESNKEDLASALDLIARESGEEILDIIIDRPFKHHQGRSYFGLKKASKVVAGACMSLGIHSRKGYGVVATFIAKSPEALTKLGKYLSEHVMPRPERYINSPA